MGFCVFHINGLIKSRSQHFYVHIHIHPCYREVYGWKVINSWTGYSFESPVVSPCLIVWYFIPPPIQLVMRKKEKYPMMWKIPFKILFKGLFHISLKHKNFNTSSFICILYNTFFLARTGERPKQIQNKPNRNWFFQSIVFLQTPSIVSWLNVQHSM